jgi:hypothetical protein
MSDGPATHDPAPGRRARLLGRWGLSLAVATVRYLLHRVPLYRRNRRHIAEPQPPDLTRSLPGDPATVQRAADGIGPLYHRRYDIAFTDAALGPIDLMRELRSDLNRASPTEFSVFEPVHIAGEAIAVGDELVVRLPGPWDGPVRVVEVTDAALRLATLTGHMEAGEITFRTMINDRGWVVFEIESWARSGDRLFHWLYDRLPVARELQLHMWSEFCQRVVDLAGGVAMTNVEMHTCKPPVAEVAAA